MSKHIMRFITGTAAVLLLVGNSATAQDTKPTSPATPGGGQITSSTPTSGKSASSETTTAPSLSGRDKSFVKEAAIGGLAEVQLGRLATEKASSPDVKQFAQKMVDEHGKANEKLMAIAKQKNIEVPTELTGKPASEYQKLSKLSGSDFDREYVKLMLDDHKKDVSEFRKQSKSGQDPDVKAFATEALPTLESHLAAVQGLAPARTSETRGTSGTNPPPGPTGTNPIGSGGRPGEPDVPGRPPVTDQPNPR
jgi:putative membrane protein